MDERQKRVHADASKSSSQIGKMYYSICPDNDKYFRSIRLARNFATGNIQPQISNPIYGTPPPELDPIPETMRTKLMSCSNMLPY